MLNITAENFEAEVMQSDKPVVIDFWASWCGPCRMFAPTFEKVGEELASTVKFAKINVDEQEELARKFRVMSIPTIIAFKNGQAVKKTMGAIGEADLKEFASNI
jgi:thioredoxin 1